jgi:hypothetical protein
VHPKTGDARILSEGQDKLKELIRYRLGMIYPSRHETLEVSYMPYINGL